MTFKDLSGLSTPESPVGVPHVPQGIFAGVLVERLAKLREAEGPRPMAEAGTRFRHSWAAMCGAKIGYMLNGVEETNPPDLAATWSFFIGQFVHDQWQDAMAERYGDAFQREVKCTLNLAPWLDETTSGHLDGVLDDGMGRTAFEVKSINGFGYKKAVGERGTAEGPRHSATVQGALGAKAVNATKLVVINLSLEAISKNLAAKGGFDEVSRIAAQWEYTPEEFNPIAEQEIRRVGKLLAGVDEGLVPARKIPDPDLPKGAVIVDPLKGRWEVRSDDGLITDAGTAWFCQYCNFQDHCASRP